MLEVVWACVVESTVPEIRGGASGDAVIAGRGSVGGGGRVLTGVSVLVSMIQKGDSMLSSIVCAHTSDRLPIVPLGAVHSWKFISSMSSLLLNSRRECA